MFQGFTETAQPELGPERLAALRGVLDAQGVDGFLVPRADMFQGEYVAARDDRLAWLTGFTGSAGFCAAMTDRAGVFVDSRYRVQVKAQVADVYSPVDWPEIGLAAWLKEALPEGGHVGFDPWLHTVDQIKTLRGDVATAGIELVELPNLVDDIWQDQPDAPVGPVSAQPLEFTGEPHADKIARLGQSVGAAGAECVVLTLPDSIAWLLNIRGSDIPRNPVAHATAILGADGTVRLFIDDRKLDAVRDHLGTCVRVEPPEAFVDALAELEGVVGIDPASCPCAVAGALGLGAATVTSLVDPCVLPKACKNEAELNGSRAAHHRDGVAMVEFLAWLDAQPAGSLTEIDVVKSLEVFRLQTNALRDISFETISGAGANGAIVHYRVTESTNAPVNEGELLLVDSGGQYVDGTTDITRTVAIGAAGDAEKRAFTLVLKGMIAVSMARWPAGLAGRDLDPLARMALWQNGMDYGHGTGHGVGSYLCVHEGPQRLARTGTQALLPGMILSNEPGFYQEGAFGIRIENLIAVQAAQTPVGGNIPSLLEFETLTYVPIDKSLIEVQLLTGPERDWLNAYHANCAARLRDAVTPMAKSWLERATARL